MGGNSSQENRTQSSTKQDPWYMAIPSLQQTFNAIAPQWQNVGLNNNEQGALQVLEQNAKNGNPYAPQIGQVATDLLNGGPDRTGMVSTNYDQYKTALQPYATGSTNPWENADFRRMTDDVTRRTMDAVKSSYQGAGIPASAYGDFAQSAGEGITRAISPLAYQASNDLTDRKLGAINSIYGAGQTAAGMLSSLDQAKLGNQQAGVDVSSRALSANDAPWMRLLDIEGQRRNMPIQNIGALENLIVPMAQLGGQGFSDTYSKTTKQASPLEIAQGWTNVAKNLVGTVSGTSGWKW